MTEPRNIEIDLLRTYVALVEMGSFTLAASFSGRSQSAVSQQLKRLEDLLGQQLLQRSARGIQMTEAGRTLHDYAQATLNRNDELYRSFQSRRGLGQQLRLGLDEHVLSREVGVLVHLARICLTGGAISVRQAGTDALRQSFNAGELDVVIGVGASSAPGAVDLCSVPLAWVASPRLRVDPLGALPLALPLGPHPLRDVALAALHAARAPWELRYLANSASALQAGVVGGHGVGMLPRAMTDERLASPPNVAHLPEPGALQAFALLRRGPGLYDLVEEVRRHLVDLFVAEV